MNQYLKNLDAHGQVGVLFIVVFGLLLIATAVFVLRSVKLASQEFATRPVRALLNTSWLVVVVFWLGWSMGDKVATVLFGLLSFFALREFMTL